MQELDKRRHGSPLSLTQALVEAALELKLGDSFFGLDLRLHLEQPVASPHLLVAGRGTAAHNDRVGRVRDDFKVVGNFGADGVCRLLQGLRVPDLVRGFRAAILFLQVAALICEACVP